LKQYVKGEAYQMQRLGRVVEVVQAGDGQRSTQLFYMINELIATLMSL